MSGQNTHTGLWASSQYSVWCQEWTLQEYKRARNTIFCGSWSSLRSSTEFQGDGTLSHVTIIITFHEEHERCNIWWKLFGGNSIFKRPTSWIYIRIPHVVEIAWIEIKILMFRWPKTGEASSYVLFPLLRILLLPLSLVNSYLQFKF